ncbi:MAG: DUF1080 domain-containing protein [Verrucomicrobiales bacterium]|nr:DUF1080 domain-containing protein [Verrucomicrobiales bacterium]
MRLTNVLLYAATLTLICAPARAEDRGKPLFDGVSLNGWKAYDMSYWTIEDEAITATASEENPCKTNQFLVWQDGEVSDFVLTVKFRLEGGPKANSGIQVRSEMDKTGHAKGYQVDISQPGAPWLGAIYDEHGRKMLAARGESTVIQPDGSLKKSSVDSAGPAIDAYSEKDWNTYEIKARGNRIEVSLNGHVTAVIEDLQEEERELSGVLALQLHSGPPMKIQFKDIFLKTL